MKKKLAAAGLITVLTLIAYSNSFNCAFQFDDITKIVTNPNIKTLKVLPHFFTGGAADPLRDFEFRPVKFALLALHYSIFGYAIWSYHLFNIILHIMNAVLVFFLVARAMREVGRENDGAALLAAAVFALHPVNTNAVDYLSNGRTVLTVSFFYLTSLHLFLKYRDNDGKGVLYLMASLLLFLLGLLTKETAATLPFVIFAWDWLFPGQDGARYDLMKKAGVYSMYFVVLALFLAWKKIVHGYFSVHETFLSPAEYFISELKALLLYVRLMFFPTNLNVDYWMEPARFYNMAVIAGGALLVCAIVFIYRRGRSDAAVVFFFLLFLITLAPESTFISLRDIAVEYRLYLPAAGFIAATVLIVEPYLKNTAMRKSFSAVLLSILCLMTFNRNTAWANPKSLWSDVVSKSPGNPRAHSNLGHALLAEKEYDAAIKEFSLSIQLDPKYDWAFDVHESLGNCYNETGRFHEAEKEYREELKLRKDSVRAYDALGEMTFAQGRYSDAVAVYKAQLESGCGSPATEYNLGVAYLMLGRYRDAEEMLQKVLPSLDCFDLRYYLAVACEKNKEMEQAIKNVEAAKLLVEDEEQREKLQVLTARLKKMSGK